MITYLPNWIKHTFAAVVLLGAITVFVVWPWSLPTILILAVLAYLAALLMAFMFEVYDMVYDYTSWMLDDLWQALTRKKRRE